MHTSIFDSNQ